MEVYIIETTIMSIIFAIGGNIALLVIYEVYITFKDMIK